MGKEIMSRLFVTCVCFLALAASTGANDEGYDDEAITRGNTYIDKLLSDMFDENDGFDPYEMEDSSVGFHKKIVFVNVSGEATLHDGTIKGLRTLHRPGDCSLQEEGDKLKVKADLGAGVLNFHYSGSAKFMNFGPTITVHGELAYIEVNMEFTVDGKTGRQGKLTKFAIDEIRGMKVWVTGLGPINWAVNPIVSGVTKIFKGFVRSFLENKVEKYIAERLPNYQFPVQGGIETEAPLTEPTRPDTPAPEETTQPPEPETTVPEEPETTVPAEPEEPETTVPEEPEEPETTVPEETEEPETVAPEEPETVAPEEPETAVPEEPEEPETEVPEEPEEPETVVPDEPETVAPEEPEEPVEPMK